MAPLQPCLLGAPQPSWEKPEEAQGERPPWGSSRQFAGALASVCHKTGWMMPPRDGGRQGQDAQLGLSQPGPQSHGVETRGPMGPAQITATASLSTAGPLAFVSDPCDWTGSRRPCIGDSNESFTK